MVWSQSPLRPVSNSPFLPQHPVHTLNVAALHDARIQVPKLGLVTKTIAMYSHQPGLKRADCHTGGRACCPNGLMACSLSGCKLQELLEANQSCSDQKAVATAKWLG